VQLGLFMNTHGIGATADGQWNLQHVPASEMQPLDVARTAEDAGFHSLWFSDHVLVTLDSESLHTASDPVTGKRAYPKRPNMLDCMVSMGAVAAVTSRVKLAPSVLVSPYRHPLSDARCLLTVDAYAPGRVVLGVGTGWMAEEFTALGLDHETRTPRTEECIEIYRRCFTDDVVAFEGEQFAFENVSMDPKPTVVPPIVFGGVTKRAARITARTCDGFYPTFVDPLATPDRYDEVLDVLGTELEAVGRPASAMHLLAVMRVRLLDAPDPEARMLGTGTAEEVLADLGALADRGFSHTVVHLDCPTGTMAEYRDRLDAFGARVVPAAAGVAAAGPWAGEPL
jgi:probable F420-dependent oxidoreductase